MIQKLKALLLKPEILVTAISIGFTLIVSFVVGISGYLITGKFWGFFLIAVAIQFIVFAVINTFLQRKDTIEGTKLLNEQLEALSKFTVKLTCAYCQVTNTVPIQLNEENRFKCEGCGQVNSVKMQFLAAQVTTPLNKVLLPAGDDSIEFNVTS